MLIVGSDGIMVGMSSLIHSALAAVAAARRPRRGA
jgi:hypothetical protein